MKRLVYGNALILYHYHVASWCTVSMYRKPISNWHLKNLQFKPIFEMTPLWRLYVAPSSANRCFHCASHASITHSTRYWLFPAVCYGTPYCVQQSKVKNRTGVSRMTLFVSVFIFRKSSDTWDALRQDASSIALLLKDAQPLNNAIPHLEQSSSKKQMSKQVLP